MLHPRSAFFSRLPERTPRVFDDIRLWFFFSRQMSPSGWCPFFLIWPRTVPTDRYVFWSLAFLDVRASPAFSTSCECFCQHFLFLLLQRSVPHFFFPRAAPVLGGILLSFIPFSVLFFHPRFPWTPSDVIGRAVKVFGSPSNLPKKCFLKASPLLSVRSSVND